MMTLGQISERLGACPANAWLGLVPTEIDEDSITFSIPVREEMAGNAVTGALHGGMLAAIVDTVCSFAWLSRNSGRVATVDMRVDYHRPALPGELIGKGRLVRSGRTIVTADAEITDSDGRLLVSGRAVMIPFPD
jgi:uncharacterized protein (TIGR00369 family)